MSGVYGESSKVYIFTICDEKNSRYLDDPQKDPLTSGQPRWPSPAYPGLIGNVLPEFLSYSQFPFPDLARPHQPFPTLAETHGYLQSFAQPHLASGAIRLNTEVVAVEELEKGAGWKVSLRDWKNGAGGLLEEIWDGVVIANGWYDTPIWPETEGLKQLRDLGLAKHSKSYRGPTEYAGKVRKSNRSQNPGLTSPLSAV